MWPPSSAPSARSPTRRASSNTSATKSRCACLASGGLSSRHGGRAHPTRPSARSSTSQGVAHRQPRDRRAQPEQPPD
eukprot:scaffold44388_cov326-Isochrysis_galbana.AAC.1